ncbi:hypothetical protein F5X98DRAFT_344921 [Xylaria grammica]|nr:hypothetical protein F5X98DRAFT_344921 [Xylaria grammica]
MGSRPQEQEAGFQAPNTHVAETSSEQCMGETLIGSEQPQEYVSLRELELVPSPNQPVFTSTPFAIPCFTPTGTNANSAGEKRQDEDELAQDNVRRARATNISSRGGVSLGKLWGQPGANLRNVVLTNEERKACMQKRDGLARMATGPRCSVCNEPFTLEVLVTGSSCNVCGFV